MRKYMKGLKNGVGIGITYIPFGITVGLIARNNGMSTLLNGVMSFGIYAGASESVFLKTIFEQNAKFFEVLITMFTVNLRYVLINMIVLRQLSKKTNFLTKILVMVGLTDETVAYAAISKEKSARYIIGLNTVPYLCFGIATVVGSLFGNLIPEMFKNSLNFILYAAFLSLLVSALKSSFKYVEVIVYVILLKLLFMYAPIWSSISGGWQMVIIMIVSSLIYALVHSRDEEKGIEYDK